MSDIKVGDKVIDKDGTIGRVTEIESKHNIIVDCINCLGSGIYCIDKNCEYYDRLKIYKEQKT